MADSAYQNDIDDEESDAPEILNGPDFVPFVMCPKWLLESRDVSDGALRTWQVLASFAGESHVAWPRWQKIVEIRGKTRMTISSHISELEAAGALRRVARFRPDGGQRSSRYVLAWARSMNENDPDEVLETDGVQYKKLYGLGVNKTLRPSVKETVPQELDSKEELDSSKKNKKVLDLKHSRESKNSGDPDSLSADFEEFWNLYPRHVAKRVAEKAYRAARRAGTSRDDVLTGLTASAALWTARRVKPEYVPHPSTWLNQQRWTDDDNPQVIGGNRITPEMWIAAGGEL